MRIENEALHEGMEHLTKKYDELKVSLRRKCGAQGIKELEAGGLLQTQLDVCQADLLRVRSERSRHATLRTGSLQRAAWMAVHCTRGGGPVDTGARRMKTPLPELQV